MLGIDIVDLKDPQLKKRNERALKLISNQKDKLTEHPNIYWLLWAAKEAVFKCRREAFNFSPTQIPVQFSVVEGEILFASKELLGKMKVTDSYILAVCSDEPEVVADKIFKTKEISGSNSVRQAIVDYFRDLGIDVSIGSDDLNLPVLLPSKEPISISHHNHWSAFAYPKTIVY